MIGFSWNSSSVKLLDTMYADLFPGWHPWLQQQTCTYINIYSVSEWVVDWPPCLWRTALFVMVGRFVTRGRTAILRASIVAGSRVSRDIPNKRMTRYFIKLVIITNKAQRHFEDWWSSVHLTGGDTGQVVVSSWSRMRSR
jgi:hypothetical protein